MKRWLPLSMLLVSCLAGGGGGGGGSTRTQDVTSDVARETTGSIVSITYASNITAANVSSYQIIGTCEQNGEAIPISIGNLITQTSICRAGVWFSKELDVSEIEDGPEVEIYAQGSMVSVEKITSNAVVTISKPIPVSSLNQENYQLSGTCSENGEDVDLVISDLEVKALCLNGNWQTPVLDLSEMSDGTLFVTADHQKASG